MRIRKNPAGKRAVVLLSGGLDSATTLYIAKKSGFYPVCLIFDYGQRHKKEIASARKIARAAGCPSTVLKIKLPWEGSSLLGSRICLPKQAKHLPAGRQGQTGKQTDIPSTYVPGRNIIFLSFALSYAEAIKAEAIFIGAHAQDYSGYPDCRPEFYRAFAKVISAGTKAGIEKKKIKIFTPLISKNKSGIIRMGIRLGVPLSLSWSCYEGARKPCGRCDSCYYRAKGFREAAVKDPLLTG